MTIVLNGTTGITTPPVSVEGSTSGTITFVAPAVAGTNTQTLVAATGTLAPLIAGTAVASTSGTSIDFTGIPSWVKRITVMFSGVSTNGSSNLQCQIGTSGGVQTSSYTSVVTTVFSGTSVATAITTGFGLCANMGAAVTNQGSFRISLIDSSTGIWACDGTLARGDSAANYVIAGAKTLSGTLDRVRITTVNGTDTFDAGSINILYE